jgi:hypothetical protein
MRHLRYLFITSGALALFLVGAAVLSSQAWTAGRAPGKLQRARSTAAARAYAMYSMQFKGGQGTLDAVYRWSLRWRLSETGRKADAAHLKRMKTLAAGVKAKHSAGMVSAADAAAARYYVAEAELWAASGR